MLMSDFDLMELLKTGQEGTGKATRLEQTTAVDAFRVVFTMKILSGQQ